MATRSQICLFSHPEMEVVAEKIARTCSADGKHEFVSQESEMLTRHLSRSSSFKGALEPRSVCFKKSINWGKFNDGFPNLFINDVKEIAGKDVIFLASFHSPQVIFEQLGIMYAIPRYLARSFTVILPYFPTGTMERVDKEGQIATAKTLAAMLSHIPMTSRGPAQLVIFDIHALQERFYFSENVIPRLESAIPLLLREMRNLGDKNNLAIAFPDDGAHKRFNSFFPGARFIICSKIRDGDQRVVKINEGDPMGLHVIIVDDLIQTGGTLKECGRALLKAGADKISAYVTHAVFPKDSWKSFTGDSVKFENFWITDSVPHSTQIAQHSPFKLLSLSDVIADTLLVNMPKAKDRGDKANGPYIRKAKDNNNASELVDDEDLDVSMEEVHLE
ncbi:unnamed protein product [Owenia fusiformis]|uniref:Uncharacterized protein n=1 Tax=Owenia fusiformis TaxID=6347 RepID=A0A8J1Y1K8_OWEFU|nr:unnamed protein product [Owenia fusiformis]